MILILIVVWKQANGRFARWIQTFSNATAKKRPKLNIIVRNTTRNMPNTKFNHGFFHSPKPLEPQPKECANVPMPHQSVCIQSGKMCVCDK